MKRLILVLSALAAITLWAGNSIFSYEGYPVQFYGRDIYSLGMGDTGASDNFRYNTGYANPAQSNRSNKTLFGTGIIAGYTSYESQYAGVKRSFRDDALDFPYFSISIPVKHHRIGFQFNSMASGVVNNQYTYTDSTIERQETDKYLYRGDLIYSYQYKDFSMGISGNYYFGHDDRTFEQSSPENTVPTKESLLKNYKNPTVSFGFLQRLARHSWGAHLTLPVTLKGDSKRSSIHSTEDAGEVSLELPMQYGISYTTLLHPQLKLAVDANYESYSTLEDEYRDGLKTGLGLAYEPESGQKYWYRSIPLRMGGWYRQLPFQDKNSEYIDEMAYTAGLSIPLKNEVSRIDLAVQYLTRGSLEKNNLSDRSLMFMFGITGFDIISKAPDRTAPREIPKAEELQTW
ncbi:MAG TPA: hypothetical protein PL020_04485 [Candidatus Cloacimonadota bacterium]|nr:hypothetical protein [Candidatus Cloacimonadota bacterium]